MYISVRSSSSTSTHIDFSTFFFSFRDRCEIGKEKKEEKCGNIQMVNKK